MSVQAWIVLTGSQKNAAVELNDGEIQVDPMEVTNHLADNLGYGAMLGSFVLPARLLNDTDYSRWVPTLGTYPIHVMDSDTLFAPVQVGP